ncbi:hypothetical protein VNI00_018113 [Paramarasmius palmivorus]|uniref:Uncharacterized protein n=1 Tax=Paramarasmius palmivorus TaxID=297713 RepID=A0AAW0B1A5_9AGAR
MVGSLLETPWLSKPASISFMSTTIPAVEPTATTKRRLPRLARPGEDIWVFGFQLDREDLAELNKHLQIAADDPMTQIIFLRGRMRRKIWPKTTNGLVFITRDRSRSSQAIILASNEDAAKLKIPPEEKIEAMKEEFKLPREPKWFRLRCY